MPITTYYAYTIDAFDFPAGGGLTLAADYDPGEDRVILEIDDDDTTLEGDLNANEDGNDSNQFGTVYDLDGNVLGGGPNVTMYAEEQYNLVGDDGSTITLYRMEYDSNPNSIFGNGILAGYLPSAPLQPGVTYTWTTSNTTPTNETEFTENLGAICFAGGTMIATPAGLRPVERLNVGDLVITRDHGLQVIRWIGARRFSALDLVRAPSLRPICVRAGSLGNGLPERDLMLSPQHKVLLSGQAPSLYFGQSEVFAPCLSLINGTTVSVAAEQSGVVYFHILFDSHEVIYAEGQPCESFHPGEVGLSTLEDAGREELFRIFPDLRVDAASFGPTVRESVKARAGRILAPDGASLLS